MAHMVKLSILTVWNLAGILQEVDQNTGIVLQVCRSESHDIHNTVCSSTRCNGCCPWMGLRLVL